MSDKEMLVVVSKLKAYIKEKANMNTSGDVAAKLSAKVRDIVDEAIENARRDRRKTVKDRDIV